MYNAKFRLYKFLTKERTPAAHEDWKLGEARAELGRERRVLKYRAARLTGL